MAPPAGPRGRLRCRLLRPAAAAERGRHRARSRRASRRLPRASGCRCSSPCATRSTRRASAGRPRALIAALHRASHDSSNQLPLDGPQRVTRFWLVNAVSLSASPAQIARIAADKDVASVDLDVEGARRRRRAGRPTSSAELGQGRLGRRRDRRPLRLGRVRDHRSRRAHRRDRHRRRPDEPRSGRQDRRLARLRERTRDAVRRRRPRHPRRRNPRRGSGRGRRHRRRSRAPPSSSPRR